MEYQKILVDTDDYPDRLRNLASPPKQLFYRGLAPLQDLLERPVLGVVGNRAITPYGRMVTERLVNEVAAQGVVIVSGLALGVDGVAHRAALAANGTTIAVLPSPIDAPSPASHVHLATAILENGGGLVSEYPPDQPVFRTNFIARNRIIAGLSNALLITEAGEQSGSLHTARFMLDIGRDVLAVPGPITHSQSAGTHNLLKSGAMLVTSADDVLLALGLTKHLAKITAIKSSNPNEQAVLDALLNGQSDGQVLLQASKLDVVGFNSLLTSLELHGKIRRLGNNQWALR